ncbi:EAL domain-containing protein [Actinotalea ferrariae]|uniref:EAL domain-containing protein n=1 Tax=Actinotalea ferrariae TaxID=1386098 RepID=UPI001C8B6A46|nr:EAL domain-containing protein [Actinotalea ferrariae]MBX9246228.1 EAL domain-containing protein [Actinotalea ferrariae]
MGPAQTRDTGTTNGVAALPRGGAAETVDAPDAGRRSLLPRGRRERELEAENAALRAQLEELRQAASDLVGSDDVETVLQRVVDRASAAGLTSATLLVVDAPDGGTAWRAHGLGRPEAAQLAARLRRGEHLGPGAVVVDVVSARRRHGRLAALYPTAEDAAHGRFLLEACAQHAAAALDLLTAVDENRTEAIRATALLRLAHDLALAADATAVAQVTADALPRIVGSRTAAVLLPEPGAEALVPVATSGLGEDRRGWLTGVRLRFAALPELAPLAQKREPVVLTSGAASPVLADLMTRMGLTGMLAAPLLAGDALMGIVLVGWDGDARAMDLDEAKVRVLGATDQAATALQNTRLLATVRHQSLHDALTGLPNRVLFARSLEATLRQAGTGVGTCVLFCDLDSFKRVNDELGHAAGDELLRQVAQRIRTQVRGGDVVARLSGDEFAVALVGTQDEALIVASRIVSALEQPFRLEGRDVRVTTSVGVCAHVGPDGRGDRMLAAADQAMYGAKQRGRNQVVVADDVERDSVVPSLEAELAEAVATGQLRLFFQPLVGVETTGCAVRGAEALIRWAHPRLGLLAPASFLPLAEETGLISELDLWAIDAACAALADQSGPAAGALRVAVNLSCTTLIDPRLVPAVSGALARHGIDASRLNLEIVESSALRDLPGVLDAMSRLRELGVRMALDDFGTGYSTLAWLHSLPVDQIKIDRSFVARLHTDPASLAVVRAVLALAHELGLEVVAEGVEEEAQLSALRDAGCGMVQGYLLGRPAPAIRAELDDHFPVVPRQRSGRHAG